LIRNLRYIRPSVTDSRQGWRARVEIDEWFDNVVRTHIGLVRKLVQRPGPYLQSRPPFVGPSEHVSGNLPVQPGFHPLCSRRSSRIALAIGPVLLCIDGRDPIWKRGASFRVLLEHRINHLCVELYSRAFLQPSRERLRRGLVGERYFPDLAPTGSSRAIRNWVTMSPSAPCDRLCQVARTSALALTPQLTGLRSRALTAARAWAATGL
jgi:hypothetical protein